MEKTYMEKTVVISQEKLSDGVYSLWLQTDKIAVEAIAGQFVSVYSSDNSRLLPRPISICEIDREKKSLRLVYRVVGAGTKEFSALKIGDQVDLVGPLGNGFPLSDKPALLLGGGIGVPPMLELAKQLPGKPEIAAGYQDQLFLTEALAAHGNLHIATEDGSSGTKGNVLDAVRAAGIKAEVIYACGPMPMLRAVKAFAEEQGVDCYISLEERMACGIGACLGCVCKTREKDHHTNVNNTRICKEGPVFDAREVEI